MFKKKDDTYSYEKLDDNDTSFFNKIKSYRRLIHSYICQSINRQLIFNTIKTLMKETNKYIIMKRNDPAECIINMLYELLQKIVNIFGLHENVD